MIDDLSQSCPSIDGARFLVIALSKGPLLEGAPGEAGWGRMSGGNWLRDILPPSRPSAVPPPSKREAFCFLCKGSLQTYVEAAGRHALLNHLKQEKL